MNNLTTKTCTAYENGTPPLDQAKVASLLTKITDWQTDNKKIFKTFNFQDFKTAIVFINKIVALAEKENHHPDLCVHDYKKVTVTLSTHNIQGLSLNDFIMASKIDEL